MKERKGRPFPFDTLQGITRPKVSEVYSLSTLYWVVVTPVLMMANMCYKCVEKSILIDLPPLQLAAICPDLVDIRHIKEPGKWLFEVSDECDEQTTKDLQKLTELAKTMLTAMGLSIIPWEFRIVTTSRWESEKQLEAALSNS